MTASYAFNFVTGLQQTDSNGVYEAIGCCKHAAAYSLDNFTNAEGVQVTRLSFDAIVTPEDMTLT